LGYQHISNLERETDILQFKYVYALEKIHGTSAHISWRSPGLDASDSSHFRLNFFSGGEKHENFVALFNQEELAQKFRDKFGDTPVIVYGEAYGGKQQGMAQTYGKDLRFVAFEVKIDKSWLSVTKAHEVALSLGLDFVDYELIPTHICDHTRDAELLKELWETHGELAAIVNERNKPSTQAMRNGMGEQMREGIVLRPPFEVTLNNGKRLIVKFKRDEFKERRTSPKILDPNQAQLIQDANLVAFEFVVMERLLHVINRLISTREDKEVSIKDTSEIIKLMVEDVTREAEGEIVDNKLVRKAIGAQAVKLFKQYLSNKLRELTMVVCNKTSGSAHCRLQVNHEEGCDFS
jgi:hypothetical protein